MDSHGQTFIVPFSDPDHRSPERFCDQKENYIRITDTLREQNTKPRTQQRLGDNFFKKNRVKSLC